MNQRSERNSVQIVPILVNIGLYYADLVHDFVYESVPVDAAKRIRKNELRVLLNLAVSNCRNGTGISKTRSYYGIDANGRAYGQEVVRGA